MRTWKVWVERCPKILRDEAQLVAAIGSGQGESAASTFGLDDTPAELVCRHHHMLAWLDRMAGDSAMMAGIRHNSWAAAFGRNLAQTNSLTQLIRNTPVLITGETGTGKELVAQALASGMAGKWVGKTWSAAKFEAINLASLPPALVASELFGHVQGAFTGADGNKPGILERCHDGVVFLDEIAELPMDSQVTLLRALQEGKVRRLGSAEETSAAPRVVSATHQNLLERVANGTFRRDLYYRLAALVIEVPPLRKRIEDVEAIVERELEQIDRTLRPQIKEQFQRFMMEQGEEHTWPGNVRELASVVRCLALGMSPRFELPHEAEAAGHVPKALKEGRWTLDEVGTWYVHHVHNMAGAQTKSAKRLGIDRGTVKKYLDKKVSS